VKNIIILVGCRYISSILIYRFHKVKTKLTEEIRGAFIRIIIKNNFWFSNFLILKKSKFIY